MLSGYSTSLCKYVISKEQNDLLVIFENFIDKVSDPETNVFFRQNEILDIMMDNLSHTRKKSVTFEDLYKGIDILSKNIIDSLEIEKKIIDNHEASLILEIDYLDEELFLSTLEEELYKIITKYNLKANDDYNKMYKFLSSLKLTLQSSDNVLLTLKHQYEFFSKYSKKGKENSEYITIYGIKHYKIDILRNLLDIYNQNNREKNKNNKVKRDNR